MGIYSMDDFIVKPDAWPWGYPPPPLPPGPEGWSGEFITVGSGKDYDAIQPAVDAANTGDMLLVYSGNYTPSSVWSKKLFIRGMGATESDVTISDTQNQTGATTGADLFFEKVRFTNSMSWRSNFMINSASVACEFSRCYFHASGYSHAFYSTSGANHPHLTFSNCTMIRGYNTIARLGQNNTRMLKCFLPSYFCWQCSGAFAERDSVGFATVGYGSGYGDFLITDDFLQAYGY